MAFIWTQTINSGDTCNVGDIIEIRTNVDYIKDNLSCLAVQSGLCTTENTSYHTSYHDSEFYSFYTSAFESNAGTRNSNMYYSDAYGNMNYCYIHHGSDYISAYNSHVVGE